MTPLPVTVLRALALALLPTLALAQAPRTSPAPAPPSRPPASPAAPAAQAPQEQGSALTSPEYQIGPEDILKVVVYGHDDLSQVVIVQADGTFMYPLIGRVKASDMSPPELARKISTLLARGFIRNPQVTVSVQEFRSKTVFVVGEVQRPGPYPLSGRTGLVEVLAKAGVTGNAGAEVVVVRPAKGSTVSGPMLPTDVAGTGGGLAATADPTAEVFRIDVRAIQTGDLQKNIVLQPNDTVFVPQAPKVYVSGEVRNPGAFPWFPGLTARQLISVAGGLTADGSDGRLRIVRAAAEGQKTKEDKISLDDAVKPGETLVVRRRLF